MNFELTPERKAELYRALINAALAALIAVIVAFTGYNLVIVPQEQTQEARQEARVTELRNQLGFDAAPAPVPDIVAAGVPYAGLDCKVGSANCLVARYGRNLSVYSDNAVTLKWKVTGSSGTEQHAGFDILDASTVISPTNGGIITPTATLQPLSSAGTVTPTLAITNTASALYTNNTLLILYNTSATTINLADSGNVNLSAAWAAAQYDTLTLRFDSTARQWIELARSDN